MKIPKRFKLLGKTITVERDPMLVAKDGAHGLSCYDEDKIILQTKVNGSVTSQQFLEQVFMHELTHFILYNAGGGITNASDVAIHKDEYFVDLVGSLLHQVFTTMEYTDASI